MVKVALGGHAEWPYDTTAKAFGDINAAVAASLDGMTIEIEEGSYPIEAEITVSKALTIIGAGKDATTLLNGSGNFRIMTLDHPQAVLGNLTISGGKASSEGASLNFTATGGGLADGIRVSGVSSGQFGVYVNGANSRLTRSEVTGCSIRAVGVAGGGRLENSLIWKNRGASVCGVSMSEGSTGAGYIRNCTVVSNESTGTSTSASGIIADNSGNASAMRYIVNCIVRDNIVAATPEEMYAGYPDIQIGSKTSVSNCCVASAVGENCQTADPLLRADGRIRATSPAVNAGLVEDWMSGETDYFGKPFRSDNAAIGCHQSRRRGMMVIAR